MKKQDRKSIAFKIKHELEKGTHTYTMCQCNRQGCRSGKCWECLLEELIK